MQHPAMAVGTCEFPGDNYSTFSYVCFCTMTILFKGKCSNPEMDTERNRLRERKQKKHGINGGVLQWRLQLDGGGGGVVVCQWVTVWGVQSEGGSGASLFRVWSRRRDAER